MMQRWVADARSLSSGSAASRLSFVILDRLRGLRDAGLQQVLVVQVGKDLILSVSVKDHANDTTSQDAIMDSDSGVEVLSKLLLLLLW